MNNLQTQGVNNFPFCDVEDDEVEVGQTIAYAWRRGSSLGLNVAEVIEVQRDAIKVVRNSDGKTVLLSNPTFIIL